MGTTTLTETLLFTLTREVGYPLKLENGRLVIDVPLAKLVTDLLGLESERAQTTTNTTKKPPPKISAAKPAKVHYPETLEQVAQVVKELLRKAGKPLAAEDFYEHLGATREEGKRNWENHRQLAHITGGFEKTGSNRGTRYSLAG